MIENIKNTLKSIAILDAIISPEWESRYFSYNSKWSDSEEMASMRDGSGNEWFLWLHDNVMAWKFLDHELGIEKNIESIISQFPAQFDSFINEKAFSIKESSCLWYFMDNRWHEFGLENKSIHEAIKTFTWAPKDYKKWADSYYENEFNIDAISSIFNNQMNGKIIAQLNEKMSFEELQNDIEEIDFRYKP